MPVFHTKTIQTILDPVAQQVRTKSLALVYFEVLFVCQARAKVVFVFILCKIMPPSVFTVCEYLKYIWQSQILEYLLFLQFCMNLKHSFQV